MYDSGERNGQIKYSLLSTVKGTKSLSCLSFIFLSPYDETKSKIFNSFFGCQEKQENKNKLGHYN